MSDESDALQLVRAKHAYAPNGDGQIALQQGELVCDALAVHKDWMRGTNSLGDHGLFPKAYVMPLRTLYTVEAQYDLKPQDATHLALHKGAQYFVFKEVNADWFDGCASDYTRSGVFPVAYVKRVADANASAHGPHTADTPGAAAEHATSARTESADSSSGSASVRSPGRDKAQKRFARVSRQMQASAVTGTLSAVAQAEAAAAAAAAAATTTTATTTTTAATTKSAAENTAADDVPPPPPPSENGLERAASSKRSSSRPGDDDGGKRKGSRAKDRGKSDKKTTLSRSRSGTGRSKASDDTDGSGGGGGGGGSLRNSSAREPESPLAGSALLRSRSSKSRGRKSTHSSINAESDGANTSEDLGSDSGSGTDNADGSDSRSGSHASRRSRHRSHRGSSTRRSARRSGSSTSLRRQSQASEDDSGSSSSGMLSRSSRRPPRQRSHGAPESIKRAMEADSDVPPPPPPQSASENVLAKASPPAVPYVSERQFSASLAVSAPANVTRNTGAIDEMLRAAGVDPNIVRKRAMEQSAVAAAAAEAGERGPSRSSSGRSVASDAIVVPPPPFEVKRGESLTLEERESQVAKWEEHLQMCAALLNEQRKQLEARETALLRREAALAGSRALAATAAGGSRPESPSASPVLRPVESAAGDAAVPPLNAAPSSPAPSPSSGSSSKRTFLSRVSRSVRRSTASADSSPSLQRTGGGGGERRTTLRPTKSMWQVSNGTSKDDSPTGSPNNSFANRAGNRSSVGLDLALLSQEALHRAQRKSRRILNRNEAARIVQAVWRGRKDRQRFARIMQRTRLAGELLSTERTYINNLTVLKRLYMLPVTERFGRKELLSRTDAATLFQNTDAIITMQVRFLQKLEGRMRRWHVEQKIGDLFVDFADELNEYQQYVSNYPDAHRLLKLHQRKKTAFDALCRKAQNDPSASRLDLESFLILPVQRIPRYIMLLRDLHRRTPPDHADYASIGQAAQLIADVADRINERKRDKDALAELTAIAERIKLDDLPERSEFAVLVEGRVLLEHYTVADLGCELGAGVGAPQLTEQRAAAALEQRKSSSYKTLVIFNDALLVCRGAASDKKLYAERLLSMKRLWAAAPSDASGSAHTLVVVETLAADGGLPWATANHYWFSCKKKEAASDELVASTIQRAACAARGGSDMHESQRLVERRINGKSVAWREELFRDAPSVVIEGECSNVQLKIDAVLGKHVECDHAPLLLVESGSLTARPAAARRTPQASGDGESANGGGGGDAPATASSPSSAVASASDSPSTVRKAASLRSSSGSLVRRGSKAALVSSPSAVLGADSQRGSAALAAAAAAAVSDGGARFFGTCDLLYGRLSCVGLLSLAPRTLGAPMPTEPYLYGTKNEGEPTVLVAQSREQLFALLRADPSAGLRLYKLVCLRLNHLLQHIPKPTSAEALAIAMADAQLLKRAGSGSAAGGGGGGGGGGAGGAVRSSDSAEQLARRTRALCVRFGFRRDKEQLLKEVGNVTLVDRVLVAGSLYVFASHLCFGGRFFDADVRRAVRMADIEALDGVDDAEVAVKLASGDDAMRLRVPAADRDMLLSALRMFVTQAKDKKKPSAPRVQPIGRWLDAALANRGHLSSDAKDADADAAAAAAAALDSGSGAADSEPYAPLTRSTLADERAADMTEAEWHTLLSDCAHSVRVRDKDIVIAEDPAALCEPIKAIETSARSLVFAVSSGAVSLEQRTDDGVTRFATLSAGATFNEIALALPLESVPTVRAVALEDTLLHVIDPDAVARKVTELLRVGKNEKVARRLQMRLLRYVAGRLRDSLANGRRTSTFEWCVLSDMN